MVTSTTEVVIIILSIVLIFAIVSACCRGLSRAYVRHLESEEMTRRRLAFNLDPGNAGIPNPNSAQRAVRVTTISREGDTIALGVYEIHMPRSVPNRSRVSRPRVMAIPPPPPFSTAYQMSSPVSGVPDVEEPPPSYDEYMKISAINELNLNKEYEKDQQQQQQRY